MNRKQQVIVIFGALVLAAMIFYPPWLYTLKVEEINAERPAGYYFLTEPPIPGDPPKLTKMFGLTGGVPLAYYGVKVDASRLELQAGLVILVTLILYITAKSRR